MIDDLNEYTARAKRDADEISKRLGLTEIEKAAASNLFTDIFDYTVKGYEAYKQKHPVRPELLIDVAARVYAAAVIWVNEQSSKPDEPPTHRTKGR